MSEAKELHIFGEIAAVLERSNCTHQEAINALNRLIDYYSVEGQLFLSDTSIAEIAQHRQQKYEKAADVLMNSTATAK